MSSSPPTTPFWFKQRQGKLESVGENVYKLTAPNQAEAFVLIRRDGDLWASAVRQTADGPDLAATPPRFSTMWNAWDAAFELYRQTCVI